MQTFKKHAAFLLLLFLIGGVSVSQAQIFVVNNNNGTVGEYSLTGSTINARLISGFQDTRAITAMGTNLLVADFSGVGGNIFSYTTSGFLLGTFIANVAGPDAMTISGGNLFEANYFGASVGSYTTNGGTNNAALITGQSEPYGLAVSGTNLFLSTFANTISEYSTSGTLINASLITNLAGVNGLAISNGHLFEANRSGNTIGEYNLDGSVVNAALITGLNGPYSLVALPEPSTYALFALSTLFLFVAARRRKV